MPKSAATLKINRDLINKIIEKRENSKFKNEFPDEIYVLVYELHKNHTLTGDEIREYIEDQFDITISVRHINRLIFKYKEKSPEKVYLGEKVSQKGQYCISLNRTTKTPKNGTFKEEKKDSKNTTKHESDEVVKKQRKTVPKKSETSSVSEREEVTEIASLDQNTGAHEGVPAEALEKPKKTVETAKNEAKTDNKILKNNCFSEKDEEKLVEEIAEKTPIKEKITENDNQNKIKTKKAKKESSVPSGKARKAEFISLKEEKIIETEVEIIGRPTPESSTEEVEIEVVEISKEEEMEEKIRVEKIKHKKENREIFNRSNALSEKNDKSEEGLTPGELKELWALTNSNAVLKRARGYEQAIEDIRSLYA
jgi:hypothetical protein